MSGISTFKVEMLPILRITVVKIADCLGCLGPGGEGHFRINLHGTCSVFQGIIFQHKFLNGIWKLVRNSETGYYYLIKNKRLLFSLLFSYCFVIKNSETEYQNAFFPEWVVETLKKWAPPRQVTFKCPPPGGLG